MTSPNLVTSILTPELMDMVLKLVATVLGLLSTWVLATLKKKFENDNARTMNLRMDEAVQIARRDVDQTMPDEEDAVRKDAAIAKAKVILSPKGVAELTKVLTPETVNEVIGSAVESSIAQSKADQIVIEEPPH